MRNPGDLYHRGVIVISHPAVVHTHTHPIHNSTSR